MKYLEFNNPFINSFRFLFLNDNGKFGISIGSLQST
jgi:hypothetical protein